MYEEESVGQQSPEVSQTSHEPVVEQELEVTEASSDETLNDDDLDTPKIPRRRFNEAVQKEREKAEAKIREIEESYAPYKKLDEYMKSDSNLNAAVNDVITRYNRGELTKKEAEAEIRQENEAAKEEVPAYVRDIQELKAQRQQDVAERYLQDFYSIASKDLNGDDELTRMIEIDAYREFLEQYPDGKDKYYRGAVEKIYKSVKSRYDLYNNKKSASYVKEKASDSIPVSHSGSSPATKVDLTNEKTRHQLFIEGMTKGLK